MKDVKLHDRKAHKPTGAVDKHIRKASEHIDKANNQINSHIEQAREWAKGITVHTDSQGWRFTCLALAEEVENLRKQLLTYGDHSPECNRYQCATAGCKCGWDVLSASIGGSPIGS